MIHPHLPVEHFQWCMFSEPIYLRAEIDTNYDDFKHELAEGDIIDADNKARPDHIAYEDILLQKMIALKEEEREGFIRHQLKIHTDPQKWLSELRKFWVTYRKEIRELEDDEFYKEYLTLIDKIAKRKMKEYPEFKWKGQQITFVELAIALYEMGVIEINKDAYSVTQFAESFAYTMGVEMDIVTVNNYKTKIKNRPTAKGRTVEEKDLKFFTELSETFSKWLLAERSK